MGLEVLNFTDATSTLRLKGENFCPVQSCIKFFLCGSIDGEDKCCPRETFAAGSPCNKSNNKLVADVLHYVDGDVIIRVPAISDQIYVVVFDQRSNVLPFDRRTPEVQFPAAGLVPSSGSASFALAKAVNTNGTSMVYLQMKNIDSSDIDAYIVVLDERGAEFSLASISGTADDRRVGVLIPPGMGKRRLLQVKRKLNNIVSLPVSFDYASPLISSVILKYSGEMLLEGKSVISASGTDEERTIVILGEHLAGPDVLVGSNSPFYITLGSNRLCAAGRVGQNSSCSCTFEESHTRVECVVQPSFEVGMSLSFLVDGEEFFAPGFISFEPPVIDNIDPLVADTQGYTIMTISGRNFLFGKDPPVVFVNSAPVEPVLSTNRIISFTMPEGTGANIPIYVSTGLQTSSGSGEPQVVRYARPTLESLYPSSGPTVGNYTVTIMGNNFGLFSTGSLDVFFFIPGVIPFSVDPRQIEEYNNTRIICRVPPGFGSIVNVSVAVTGQDAVESLSFSYDPPVVNAVAPFCGEEQGCMGRVGVGGLYSQPDKFSFERDGCSSEAIEMKTESGVSKFLGAKRSWESFSVYRSRQLLQGYESEMVCENIQYMDLFGTNFGPVVENSTGIGVYDLQASATKPLHRTTVSALCASSKFACVRTHHHLRIPIYSFGVAPAEFGIQISVGGASTQMIRVGFLPPKVTRVSLTGANYRDHTIVIEGWNFDERDTVVLVGHEYDKDGEYCAERRSCMKPCLDLQVLSFDSEDGRPYIRCRPQPDIVGARNITVVVHGQVDDCSRNSILCAHGADERNAMFYCASNTNRNASVGNFGEVCADIEAGSELQECEDENCLQASSRAGFYKLQLNLEVDGENECSKKGHTCPFIYPDDARAALGFAYKPWATAEGGRPFEFDVEAKCDQYCTTSEDCETNYKCVSPGRECPKAGRVCARVEKVPGCSHKRWDSIVTPERVYEVFPAMQRAKNCESIVACQPAESCLGQNKCAKGYQYAFFACSAWTRVNGRQNCTSNVDCRGTDISASGLVECDRTRPWTCSTCDKSSGQCICDSGTNRCGRCTLPGPETKGYYRQNGKCEVCPDNPILVVVVVALIIILAIVGSYILSRKSFPFSYIIIGVDFFQTMSLFSAMDMDYPPWLKSLLRLLLFFNLDVDLTAPECIFPDLDFTEKWGWTIASPLIFIAIMGSFWGTIFGLKVAAHKFLGYGSGKKNSLRGMKLYTSHSSKLIAMTISGIYFLYIVVTRRAFEVFDCNPVGSDGYLYTTFTSQKCYGGLCKCYDAVESTQLEMVGWAVLAIILVTVGFPLAVAFIARKNKWQMVADQIILAHGKAYRKENNPECYTVRTRYRVLYHHFHPHATWWMVVLIVRKSAIATLQLLLRSNPTFMITSVLLVLFLVFNAHTHFNPFMSPADFSKAVSIFKRKVDRLANDGREHADMSREEIMLRRVVRTLEIENAEESITRQRLDGKSARNFDRQNAGGGSTGDMTYTHDYNVMERAMLSAAIVVCVLNLMYVGVQGDESSAQNVNASRTIIGVLIVVTVMVASLYYIAVFVSELTGSKTNISAPSPGESLVRLTGLDLTWNPMQTMAVQRTTERDSPAVAEYVTEMRNLRAVNAKQEQQLNAKQEQQLIRQASQRKKNRGKRQRKILRPRAMTGQELKA